MIRVVLTLALLVPSATLACACCADPGHRVTYIGETGDWHQRQIDEIVFAPTVNLYSDACGDDCINGVIEPRDSYGLSVVRNEDGWQITLTQAGTTEATLRFAMPEMFEHFSTDLAPAPGTMMPAPYSEFRHRVKIEGTGDFETAAPVEGELIFAGQSVGRCDALLASTHWFLDVRTDDTRWRLYGNLVPSDP